MVPYTCPAKYISGGQQEEGHGVVHHVQGEHQQSSLDHFKMPIYKEYLNHKLGLTLSTPGLVCTRLIKCCQIRDAKDKIHTTTFDLIHSRLYTEGEGI